MKTTHQLGRAFIVFGYSLAALGSIVELCNTLSQSYANEYNVRAVLEYISTPLAALATLCAWWFLAALVVTEDRQVALVRRGFLGLSVQALAQSVLYFVIVSTGIGLSWALTSFWFIGVGEASASVGFFLIYLAYRGPSSPADVDATPDIADEPEVLSS